MMFYSGLATTSLFFICYILPSASYEGTLVSTTSYEATYLGMSKTCAYSFLSQHFHMQASNQFTWVTYLCSLFTMTSTLRTTFSFINRLLTRPHRPPTWTSSILTWHSTSVSPWPLASMFAIIIIIPLVVMTFWKTSWMLHLLIISFLKWISKPLENELGITVALFKPCDIMGYTRSWLVLRGNSCPVILFGHLCGFIKS